MLTQRVIQLATVVWVLSLFSYGAHITTLIIAFAHMRRKLCRRSLCLLLTDMLARIMWFPLVMDGQVNGLNMCSLTYIDRFMLIANALPLPLELFMLFAVGFKYQGLRRGGPSRLSKYTVAREGVLFFAVGVMLLLFRAAGAHTSPGRLPQSCAPSTWASWRRSTPAS
jgi:hypothetical protein